MMFTSQRAIMHVKQLLRLSRGSAIDTHQEEESGGQLALYFFWVLTSIWKQSSEEEAVCFQSY